MQKIQNSLVLLCFVLMSFFGSAQTTSNLHQKLVELFPKAEITVIENLEGYSESYQLILDEPLDHKNPQKGTFKHYIYLSHLDFNKPMVVETHGYNTGNIKSEVSKLLNANQIAVEYRFYGKSRPEPLPWEYLTNDQAIADYHVIVTKLKQIYSGKWVSTGISKGGETALIYKSKYPNDVDVAMPYVAPLINTQEDSRTINHDRTIGTPECRAAITVFQRAILENREAVLKEFAQYAEAKKMTFAEVPFNESLEYAVLEFPFSFWQWGGKCEAIPSPKATPKELFNYLNDIVGMGTYNDKNYFNYLPSYYQHLSELGYYGFDLTPVVDLLQVVKSSSNDRFAPKDVVIKYNPKYIKKVRKYVENKGNKILYIYGGYDTWFSCSPTPNPKLDALKMVLPAGSHSTRVKNFPEKDQKLIKETLNRWLEIKPLEYNAEVK
ncbi:PS-10 peptidase S37 [Flavobacterium sp. 90]|uniref:S28 family serine protease n=1 Tax=unclassified Flavobacterium TaxID=196869 RepID=UPI000EADF3A1|nr:MULTISPECIES: S28 family serine protease [unclassified Flavobacterium]RKR11059.1 PS-10 peptidase S37 [Flavobacterium sp. 81]TCK54842.1 PS-10 peptidase S37 [Flavobacterium sp. 90]